MATREEDIETLCNFVLKMGVTDTGDYGTGGECPFCFMDCDRNEKLSDIKHYVDCPVLVAKDLMAGK